MEAASDPQLFTPVNTNRISIEIVDQIKTAIADRRLVPGDKLPSERDLTERFGVSRVTVRDALRILEATGLIEIRVGARGGAFVSIPAPRLVGEGFANMLLLSSATPEQVTEARMIFEVGMIPLICDRRTDEDIHDLREICARAQYALKKNSYDMHISAEFHVRLAGAAHNAAIELIVDSLRGPLLASLLKAKEAAPQMGRRGVTEHLQLIDAIEARDETRATDILSKHLTRTARRLGIRAGADSRSTATTTR
jgi:GntR family transcriptional repressor for pyruvate dehydrogenase complex